MLKNQYDKFASAVNEYLNNKENRPNPDETFFTPLRKKSKTNDVLRERLSKTYQKNSASKTVDYQKESGKLLWALHDVLKDSEHEALKRIAMDMKNEGIKPKPARITTLKAKRGS